MPMPIRDISEDPSRSGPPPRAALTFARAARKKRADGGRLVRRLSRNVYLILYIMILVREGSNLLGLSHDPPAAVEHDLRSYLIFAIFALVTIRVMASLRRGAA